MNSPFEIIKYTAIRMMAPVIDIIIRGLELPNIIGIGPIIMTPPVSICPSCPPLREDRKAAEKIIMIPNIIKINPIAINLSKDMIQNYLNSS